MLQFKNTIQNKSNLTTLFLPNGLLRAKPTSIRPSSPSRSPKRKQYIEIETMPQKHAEQVAARQPIGTAIGPWDPEDKLSLTATRAAALVAA